MSLIIPISTDWPGSRKFLNPNEVWNYFVQYFHGNKDRQIKKNTDTVADKGNSAKTEFILLPLDEYEYVSTMPISVRTWRNYKKDEDYAETIEEILTIIDTHRRQGATVGLFNAQIVMRQQGIKEKIDVTSNDKTINEYSIYKASDNPVDGG